ncbi:MAG: SGNH/GDSL hydrolase family protein [Thermoanaerobaculales bacterium]|nr:SGNH/GDSL hydrolase family protein [Thermoanaerobaculales bacterium]
MNKRIILLCVSTVLVLFAAEALFRLAMFVKTPRGLVFDSAMVFSFAPRATVYGLKLNNIGALGDDVIPRTARGGSLRVFLFGGSTSYSLHYVNTVREALQNQLNRDCSVTSFGRPRYTSYQARVLAQNVFAQYRPDVAVLYLGINDTIFDTFWWVDGPPNVGFMDWRDDWPPLLFQGIRYHLIHKRIRSTPSFPQGALRSERILRSNIEKIADEANQEGVHLVLSEFALAVPTDDQRLYSTIQDQEPVMRHFWGNIESTIRAVDAHNAVLGQIAIQRDIELAPVARMIPRSGEYFNDICHLTAIGNEILAKTVATSIVRTIAKNQDSTSEKTE